MNYRHHCPPFTERGNRKRNLRWHVRRCATRSRLDTTRYAGGHMFPTTIQLSEYYRGCCQPQSDLLGQVVY